MQRLEEHGRGHGQRRHSDGPKFSKATRDAKRRNQQKNISVFAEDNAPALARWPEARAPGGARASPAAHCRQATYYAIPAMIARAVIPRESRREHSCAETDSSCAAQAATPHAPPRPRTRIAPKFSTPDAYCQDGRFISRLPKKLACNGHAPHPSFFACATTNSASENMPETRRAHECRCSCRTWPRNAKSQVPERNLAFQ